MNIVPNPTELKPVLDWIVQYGAPIIVAYLVAQLLEKWKIWNGLPTQAKFILPVLGSVALSLLASWLLSIPGFIEQYGPIFSLVMSSVVAYLSSQKGHMDTKNALPDPKG